MGHRVDLGIDFDVCDMHILALHVNLRPDRGRIRHLADCGNIGIVNLRHWLGARADVVGSFIRVLWAAKRVYRELDAVFNLVRTVRSRHEHPDASDWEVLQWLVRCSVLERSRRNCWGYVHT